MNVQRLGQLVAEAMEQIEAHYGDTATFRTAALIVELDLPDSTELLVTATDDRPWCQIAFLDEALASLERRRDRAMRELEE